MATTATSRQDETVDLICWRHYGRTRDVTEIVLTANPGLAALGAILPFGTTVTLPDVVGEANDAPLVNLWG